MLVDRTKTHGLLIIYSYPGSSYGYFGVLQKGPLQSIIYQESDLIGNWAGAAARVGSDFHVTEMASSIATIVNTAGLALGGTDGDGPFTAVTPGIVKPLGYSDTVGIFVSGDDGANQVESVGASYYGLYAMSFDKSFVAAAFFTSLCGYNLFDYLPDQKLAIWSRQ